MNTANSIRMRRKNFNEFEKSMLVDIVKDFLEIIENKKTDGVTVKQKEAAWKKILEVYNPSSETGVRSQLQLQALYLSLKKKARKDYASDWAETYKTGGGSFSQALDVTGEIIMSMMSCQFIPVSNSFDSSAALYQQIEEVGEGQDGEASLKMVNQCDITPNLTNPEDEEDIQFSSVEDRDKRPICHSEQSSTPVRKRKNAIKGSPKELMDHIGQRKKIKSDFDIEIHNKRMEILQIELEIKKKKQLEQATRDFKASRLN